MHILEHTFFDILRVIPFLFATYLLLEWMENHHDGKMEQFLKKHRAFGVPVGAIFGIVPECGFSSAASSLYATGVVSAGTLIAVYLSTSDEMLPILISANAGWDKIAPILFIKIVTALIAGYLADAFFFKKKALDIETFCEEEHCHCHKSIFKPALFHTLHITAWLFVVTLCLNIIVHYVGTDALAAFIQGHPTQSVLCATLIGMIPSCASSILLSTLYLEGVIGFASVSAGLLANAGIGLMVLFRVNHNVKDSMKIVTYLWSVSFIAGLILEFIF